MSKDEPQATTLYLASFIHSKSREELDSFRGLLCVQDGRIAWIEREVEECDVPSVAKRHGLRLQVEGGGTECPIYLKDANLVVVEEGFICPGMVDTHTHAPQYPNNGLGHTLQLLEWLDTLTFPLEERFANLDYAKTIYPRVVARNLAAGTTTASYYGTLHVSATIELANACREAGQRALVGRCSMDIGKTYAESSAAASEASTAEYLSTFPTLTPSPTALVQPILTPRFALSCTPALLTSLGELATKSDLRIQTHISENLAEIQAVKEAFPNLPSYAAVYDHFNLLTPRTILAHGVHLTLPERALIKERGSGVAHCPGSNVNLNSGAARVLSMMEEGIKLGLGSDCSGGPATGILHVIRSAGTVARVLAFEGVAKRGLSVPELWWLATRGGGELCGLNVGVFEEGMEFDALWVRARGPGMWVEKGEETSKVFEKWLFTGDDRDISAVWVGGRCVSGESP